MEIETEGQFQIGAKKYKLKLVLVEQEPDENDVNIAQILNTATRVFNLINIGKNRDKIKYDLVLKEIMELIELLPDQKGSNQQILSALKKTIDQSKLSIWQRLFSPL